MNYLCFMKKNIFFAAMVFGAAVVSCRSDDDLAQQIDQVVLLYIDSAGKDMLNTGISGSYQSVTMNDVNGLTDTAPVSFTQKYDLDSLRYIEYVAGARRILVDSSDAGAKVYQSRIALIITQKKSDSVTSVFSDTLVLNYVLKPDIFYVDKAWYRNRQVFTKTPGQANIVKVTK